MVEIIKTGAPIASVFVALLAFFVAWYSVWATRRHNRLSVQPRFTTFTSATDQDEATGVALYKLVLRNSGLGPAFIRRFEVLIEGVAYQPKKPEEFFALVSDYLKVDFAVTPRYLAVLRVGYVMAKDEEQTLADVGVLRPPKDFDEKLKHIHLRITFESAYGVIDCYDTNGHEVATTDTSDLRLASRLLWQKLKVVAFNRLPVLRWLR
jgi:hypothetical protein